MPDHLKSLSSTGREALVASTLLIGLLLSTCLAFAQKNGRESLKKKPNVIIILADDQGWGDLSMNGNQTVRTPNIDGIAKNGAHFERFYVSPVCSPTRAELLTGRYHPRTGVYSTSEGGERINLDEYTLAEAFKAGGYATAAFGKWHNGMQFPYHPNARGFDEFYGFCSGHWGNYFNTLLDHNGRVVQGEGFIIDDLTNKAMAFMEENRQEPFLVYLPYNTPHSPMQVPDAEWDRFKNKSVAQLADERTGAEDIDFTRAALALTENIDWNVGRIQDKLKELDLDQETIVLYFSDNGPNSSRWNGGLKGKKSSTDEGGVKSVCAIQWPGVIPAGLAVRPIAGAIDLLPTLTDLVGIDLPAPKPLDGVSLKPLLRSAPDAWPDRMYFSHWSNKVAVRYQNFILDADGHLFDLQKDPAQLHAIDDQNTSLKQKLSEAVGQWKSEMLPAGGLPAGGQPQGKFDLRRFPVGHPLSKFTQLPARDGKGHGDIKRSSKHPNSSYFTNWKNHSDYIGWEVDVLTEGDYAVELYYTCSPADVGSTMQLSFGSDSLDFKVAQPHDGRVIYAEYDRVQRSESYEKDFKAMKAGVIHLKKGPGELRLSAKNIPAASAMDFRLMLLTKTSTP